MDTLIQHIPESEIIHIAQEVVKHIPEPDPGIETWVYGLLVLSGWVVAGMLAGFYWYQVKNLIAALMGLNETMVAVKEHIQNKDVADSVTRIKEDVIEIKAKINSL